MRYSVMLAAALCVTGGGVKADVPQVVTDIPPVHSLTARVMEGAGTPQLLIAGTASPHDFALTPAQAGALADADLVFWMGEALAPGLGRSITALSETAEIFALIEAEGIVTHAYREDAGEDRDHAHSVHAHDDGPAHDEEHARDEDHAHDDYADDHSGLDPHGWLDPENAIVWTGMIAAALADTDPKNAALYHANAEAAEAELRDLITEMEGVFAGAAPMDFVVFHDAYQYFESRFGLSPVGAISVSSAEAPSAAQVALIRDRLEGLGEVCVFTEPQFDQRIVSVITEGTQARSAVIDPLGAQLEPGTTLYPDLIRKMTESFVTCQ